MSTVGRWTSFGKCSGKIIYKTVEKLLTNTGRGCIIKVRKDKTEWSLSELHKNEQGNIDRQVELDEKAKQSTFKVEPAEKGFELFWKYLEE